MSSSDDYKTILGNVSKRPENDSCIGSCLIVVTGNDIGRIYHIKGVYMLIGRGDECDVICDNPLASRRHAQIEVHEDKIQIKDLGSTNGTLLNFEPITKKMLTDGDKISIGHTILKFVQKDIIEKTFHDELYKLTCLDGLTQATNRAHFEDILNREFSRTKRAVDHLGLCMLDIDHFKEVNDTYGHQVGDLILRELADLISEMIRKEDIFARYGGEEFCILLPGQDQDRTWKTAEKIRKAVEEYQFVYDEEVIPLTISIGICCYSESLESAEAMIGEADKRLYMSKEAGRNRTTAAKISK